jgi:hypothetical protein
MELVKEAGKGGRMLKWRQHGGEMIQFKGEDENKLDAMMVGKNGKTEVNLRAQCHQWDT